MVEDAKKEKAAKKKEEKAQNKNSTAIVSGDDEQVQYREQQQEQLVSQLETENASRMSRQEGKRRTKCVIQEVKEDKAPVSTRTKIEVTEVSGLAGMEAGSVGKDVSNAGQKRKAKSRKDREERLKQAMQAVEAERQAVPSSETDTTVSQDATEVRAPAPRFAQLSDEQIEQSMSEDANKDEDAVIISDDAPATKEQSAPASASSQNQSMWGTKTVKEEDTAHVVARGMEALLDVEELD